MMDLSVIWRLNDLMSSPMQKITKTAQTAQNVMNSAATGINKTFDKSGQTVQKLQRKLADLSKSSSSVSVNVSTDKALSEVASLQKKLSKIEQYKSTLTIGVDAAKIDMATKRVLELRTRLDQVKQQTAIDINTRELDMASRKAMGLRTQLKQMAGVKSLVGTIAMSNEPVKALEAIRARVAGLQGYSSMLKVGIDDKEIDLTSRKLIALTNRLDRMSGTKRVLGLDVSTDKALSEVASLQKKLSKIEQYKSTLTIGVDAAKIDMATKRVLELRTRLDQVKQQTAIDINTRELDMASRKAMGLRTQLKQMAGVKSLVGTIAMSNEPVKALEAIRARVAGLQGYSSMLKVGIDDKEIDLTSRKLIALTNRLDRMSGTKRVLGLDVSTDKALSEVASLQKKLLSLEQYKSTLTIGVDATKIDMATRRAIALEEQLKQVRKVEKTSSIQALREQRQLQRTPVNVFSILKGWAKEAGNTLSNTWKKVGYSVDELQQKIGKLQAYRNSLKIGIDSSEIRKTTADLNVLQKKLAKTQGEFMTPKGGFGGGVWGMMRQAVPAIGIAGLVAGTGSLARKGMDREVAVSNYEQFIPDQTLARKTFADLNQWGNDTIYKNSDVLNVGAKVAEQFGATAVMPQMKMYGDLAGGNAEDLKGIARTMGQIKGVGRLQGDELNELANHGILGLQEQIAKLKGVSLSTFNSMKEKGQISFLDVQKAMEAMVNKGGKYYGRLDRMSLTTFGRLQKLIGTVEEKFTGLGMMSLPFLNEALDWANKFIDNWQPIGAALNKVVKAFRPLWEAVHSILEVFGVVPKSGDGVIETITFISSIMTKLAHAIEFVSNVVNNLVQGIKALPFGDTILKGLVLYGVLAKIGVIGATIDLLPNIGMWIKGFRELLPWMMQVSNIPWSRAMLGVNGLRSVWMALNATFEVTPIGAIIISIIALVAAITYAWENSETFREVVIRSWEAIKAVFEAIKPSLLVLWEIVKSIAGNLWGFIKLLGHFFMAVWGYLLLAKNEILTIWNGFSDRTKSIFIGIGEIIKTTIRSAIAVATLGMSELAIFAYKKLAPTAKAGYNSKQATDKVNEINRSKQYFNKDRSATESIRNSRRAARTARLTPTKPPVVSKVSNLLDIGNAGETAKKAGKQHGVSDTVEGTKSKTITINIDKLLGTTNIYTQKEEAGKRIQDEVLDALNRILLSGDRLAMD